MSRRAGLEQRLERLGEISDIMSAMKNMALNETRKLGRFMVHQQRVVDGLEAVARDFLAFHPQFGAGPGTARGQALLVLILIGSERGFCGEFNSGLVRELNGVQENAHLIVCGRRLSARLGDHPGVFRHLPGAAVAEETPAILDRLIEALRALPRQAGLAPVIRVLSHDAGGLIGLRTLLPIEAGGECHPGFAPRLNEAPEDFFRALTDHYLAARLPALIHESLMAENRQRLAHMESALNRLGTKLDDLGRLRNQLRQAEITEQIEVILLSADANPETSPPG